jgi:hypothetical protein
MNLNPNYVAPQSASAPITTNLRKDELAALLTVDQNATAQQRVIATGNSVPLVFCLQSDATGGAWVTPPAARYGVEENANTGDYFAFGLVISDGLIGSIAAEDVWKGPIRVNTLSEFGVTNAYGSIPTTDYNYTLSSVGPDTPASETTTTETFNYSETNVNFSFTGKPFSITVEGCRSFSFAGTRIVAVPGAGLNYNHNYVVTADGVQVASSNGTESSNWSGSFTFDAPVRLILTVNSIFTWPNPAYLEFTSLVYRYQVTTTVVTPEIPGAVTNLPLFAGSGGSFAGLSTLAVKGRYAVDAETGIYKQQIRCFVRNGIQVSKVQGGTGSSSSFPDLVYYLLNNASRISANLIDLPSLQLAHNFNNKYQLYFNGVLANSVNLRDYLTRVAPMFLLRFVQINGKFALRPVLPIDGAYNISLAEITPSFVFDDANIVADSYQKEYFDINQRKPFCALMTWRSQSDTIYGSPKTNEVRYAGTAVDGPFEQYDMEEFCTTESHASLIGKYILATRKHVTHAVSFQTTALVGDLAPTDIVRVNWDYASSFFTGESTSIFYQVDSVTEGADGVFRVEATHFPLTASGISQVALDMLTEV